MNLTLVFENCEVAVVPKENVTHFGLYGITDSLFYNKFCNGAEKVAAGYCLGVEHPDYKTVERCLKYKDITQIEWEGVIYHIDWPHGFYDENPNQTVEVTEGGDLLIESHSRGVGNE